MDQQIKDKLCKHIDTEIEKISNMPALNETTLANLYKLIDIKKDLLEIEKKELELGMEEYQGNSMRGNGYSYRGGQGVGNSRMPARYYGNGYSMDDSYGGPYDYDEREMPRRQMMNNNMY